MFSKKLFFSSRFRESHLLSHFSERLVLFVESSVLSYGRFVSKFGKKKFSHTHTQGTFTGETYYSTKTNNNERKIKIKSPKKCSFTAHGFYSSLDHLRENKR